MVSLYALIGLVRSRRLRLSPLTCSYDLQAGHKWELIPGEAAQLDEGSSHQTLLRAVVLEGQCACNIPYKMHVYGC